MYLQTFGLQCLNLNLRSYSAINYLKSNNSGFDIKIIRSCRKWLSSGALTSAFIIMLTWPATFHYGCHLWTRNMEFNFLLAGGEGLLKHIGGLQHWGTEDGRDNHNRPKQQPLKKYPTINPAPERLNGRDILVWSTTDISQSAHMQPGDTEACMFL